MKRLVFLTIITGILATACGRGSSSGPFGGSQRSHDDSLDSTGVTTDPIVAHFFNTASIANDEAAVVAATQDGGANADAGE